MKRRHLCLALFLSTLASAIFAQPKKPLTNDDVIQLVKAQLQDKLIVRTIETQESAFDLSPQGLIALKNASVPDTVLGAMLEPHSTGNFISPSAGRPTTAASDAEPKSTTVPGLPDSPGVYVKTARGFTALEELQEAKHKVKGVLKANIPYVGLFSGPKVQTVFRGAHAPVQLTEARPTLYVRGVGTPAKNTILVQLETKKNSREIQTASIKGLRGAENGYPEKRIRDISAAQLSSDVTTVTPKADLGSGEYMLVLGSGAALAFGIAAP